MAPREAIALNRLPSSNSSKASQQSPESAVSATNNGGAGERSSTPTNLRSETQLPISTTVGQHEERFRDCCASGVGVSDRAVGFALFLLFVTTVMFYAASSKTLWDPARWKSYNTENSTEADFTQKESFFY